MLDSNNEWVRGILRAGQGAKHADTHIKPYIHVFDKTEEPGQPGGTSAC